MEKLSHTPDTYRTIEAPVQIEIPRIKGSRFIGKAFPVSSPDTAETLIHTVKKEFHDATHHCSAYRIGVDEQTFRYQDDGEPAGTAGLPIFRQIKARDLTDILVVVIRYFGGTKLGTGGLIRAYSQAASAVLDHANIVEKVLYKPVQLRFSYAHISPVMHLIQKFQGKISDTQYTEETQLTVWLPASQVNAFLQAFKNALRGQGQATLLDTPTFL